MAIGPTLYGVNLYDRVDYSINPPFLIATDSLTSSDSTANSINTPVADSMSAPTDSTANTISAARSDSLPPTDSAATHFNSAIVEFLLCKEFITSQVKRSQVWIMGGVSRTTTPHIYGNVLYAKNMYSTNIAILWASAKRDAIPTFTGIDGVKTIS